MAHGHSAPGVAAAGIERSLPMVTELRKKPGSGDITVSIGDMATTTVQGVEPQRFLPAVLPHLLGQDDW